MMSACRTFEPSFLGDCWRLVIVYSSIGVARFVGVGSPQCRLPLLRTTGGSSCSHLLERDAREA